MYKMRELEAKYHNAIYSNDIETVKKLLDDNEELNIDVEMVNSPPILYAAQYGYWDLFTVLFERGADLDVKNKNFSFYVIHECAINAPIHIAKSVIKESNINVETGNGETPLMLAIKNDRLEIIDYILESGRINYNMVDKDSNNILHYAAMYDNHSLFLRIIEKTNQLFKKNKNGELPENLLKDEKFRLSLAQQFENIVFQKAKELPINEVIEKIDEEKKPLEIQIKEPVKNIPGLSSIKKR